MSRLAEQSQHAREDYQSGRCDAEYLFDLIDKLEEDRQSYKSMWEEAAENLILAYDALAEIGSDD